MSLLFNILSRLVYDPDNHNGVITCLEPDILECEAKWALGSITTNEVSGGDGIPAELFQILKDDAVKLLHSICQQIWKMQQWPKDLKVQISFQSQRKAIPKNAQTTAQLHSSHTLVKSCSKFSKPGFSNMWTVNSQMFKLLLKKAKEPEIKLPISSGKSHGRRSLVGCSPWGYEESDTTEQLHFHFSHSCIGEGNSNPLQCSCLENPRDGGAWRAAINGVAQSRTWLKWLSINSWII